jgi:hypothetical protein
LQGLDHLIANKVPFTILLYLTAEAPTAIMDAGHVRKGKAMSLGLKFGASLLMFGVPAMAHAADDQRNFMVGLYEEVVVEGDIQVDISNNSGPSAKAVGDAKLVDALKFEHVGKVVRITLPQPSRAGGDVSRGNVRIKLTGRNIRKLSLRGTGRISIDAIKSALGQFDIRGPGEIQVGKLTSEKVQVLLYGNGRMVFDSGSTPNGAISVNGAGTFDAPKFEFGTLNLMQIGAGTTNATAMRDVTITNSGPSMINIGGSGTCVIRQAGSGKITCPNKGGIR